MNDFKIDSSWREVLRNEYEKPYFGQLLEFIRKERNAGKKIFPPPELVFNAFRKTPYDKVKVLIMGQDPYHGVGQAHGLSFSVQEGVRHPPSLKNIFKELVDDAEVSLPIHGSLDRWAEQGVLLLNAILTVEEGNPLSHSKLGWERFTDAVIRVLALRQDPIIFMLWGENAIRKCVDVPELKEAPRHYILTAPHPSPFSARRGFFGCKHFSKANEILRSIGKTPIDWQL